MLSTWLADASVAEFRAATLQRSPLARASTAGASRALFDWSVLDRVLAAADDILVVARGHLLDLPVPRSVEVVRGYFQLGVGLCIRHAERADPGLASVARAFETDLGTSQVQLFVTPAGTHGFGWHYDDEDVFIAQTAGIKDYYFRANTVTSGLAHPREFAAYPGEQSPLCTATLVPGDFLYIPARWWHMAICHEDALSISVGVRPRRS